MSFLQMVKKESPTFNVVMWYEKGEMNTDSLKDFKRKYDDIIQQLELEIIQNVGDVNEWKTLVRWKDF